MGNVLRIISFGEARANGFLRYFTGKPCRRGHIAERHTSNGVCMECHKMKMAARYALGLTAEASRKWQENHPGRLAEVQKATREKNAIKNFDKKRAGAAANADKRRQQARDWRAEHPEAYREYQRRRLRLINEGGGEVDPSVIASK